MKRYKKFVFEAEEGIGFDVSEGECGELIIRANRLITENSSYNNYSDPPIPYGYKYVCGEWNNGFTIERILDGSQFVWVPVGMLKANGTLDGTNFTEKFGRRNFRNDEFSSTEFYELLNDNLIKQFESVKKYGGYYISRFAISMTPEGLVQSIRNVYPLTNINFDTAMEIASRLEQSDEVQSHLMFGAEYDTALEWFIETGAKTYNEVVFDSTEWGNNRNTKDAPGTLTKTGSNEKWCVNNIYDFDGNTNIWTQEQNDTSYRVVRGGSYFGDRNRTPVTFRNCFNPDYKSKYTGLMAVLWIA